MLLFTKSWEAYLKDPHKLREAVDHPRLPLSNLGFPKVFHDSYFLAIE